MKFLKYCLCISLSFCGCVDAAPKEKMQELTCPYILPPEKDFPATWAVVGKLSPEKWQLRETIIIDGNANEEKERISKTEERAFSREIIDEWEDFKDRSEAIAEYSEDHEEMSMMCTYSKNQKEYIDPNLNVVVFIPLPSKKPVSCLLTRRDVDPTHEMSCKVN